MSKGTALILYTIKYKRTGITGKIRELTHGNKGTFHVLCVSYLQLLRVRGDRGHLGSMTIGSSESRVTGIGKNLATENVRNGDASLYPAKQKMATQVQMLTIVHPPENNPSRHFTSRQEIEVIACPILQPVTSSSLGRVGQENPVSELLPSQPLRK